MTARHFPPPWLVAELEACFVVIDSAGQKLSYVYFEDEPGRRSAAKLLSKDEARRIALSIAKLPKRPTPEQRGSVENWLEAEDAAGQRWALAAWALVGVGEATVMRVRSQPFGVLW